jgi:beta-phosphoglucomutase-like phosphatase (HAD superfamily)
MKNCKAAIFDVDGTLIDSMDVWARIDEEFLKRRGFSVPEGYMDTISPMGFYRAAEYTIDLFSLPEKPEDLIAEWDALAMEEYRFRVPLKPFAKELLCTLQKRGIKLAVATALSPVLLEPVLKNNGILHLFDAVCGTHEVPFGKGHPDIYLLAARKLETHPEDCIVFEDILAGIQGAKAAGMRAYAMYDSHADAQKKKIQKLCDGYFNHFGEVLAQLAENTVINNQKIRIL